MAPRQPDRKPVGTPLPWVAQPVYAVVAGALIGKTKNGDAARFTEGGSRTSCVPVSVQLYITDL